MTRTPRIVLLVIASLLALAGAFAPAVAAAGPVATPLVLGGSVLTTLTVSDGATCAADFSVSLSKAQTLQVVANVASGLTSPTIEMWAASGSPEGTLTVPADSQNGAQFGVAYLLAPADGAYFVRVLAHGTPATCTVSAAFVSSIRHRLVLGEVRHVTAGRNSWVAVWVAGEPDQIENPISFQIERRIHGHWVPYAKVQGSPYESTPVPPGGRAYVAAIKLHAGLFRVRARLTDALHPAGQYSHANRIVSDSQDLTELLSTWTPATAVKKYAWAVKHHQWLSAFTILPPAQQRSYGTPEEYGSQISQYGITGFTIGKTRRHGSKATIVVVMHTPAMDIGYTWKFVKLDGVWYVKSRSVGGTL